MYAALVTCNITYPRHNDTHPKSIQLIANEFNYALSSLVYRKILFSLFTETDNSRYLACNGHRSMIRYATIGRCSRYNVIKYYNIVMELRVTLKVAQK